MTQISEYWNENEIDDYEDDDSEEVLLNGERILEKGFEAPSSIADYFVTSEGIQAFSDPNSRDEWLANNKEMNECYRYCESTGENVRHYFRESKQEDREKLLNAYMSALQKKAEAIDVVWQCFGINSIDEWIAFDNPLFNKLGHSVFLWKHCGYRGVHLYLEGSVQLPVLWGINDAISSVTVRSGGFSQGVRLYQHSFFRGRSITVVAAAGWNTRRIRCLKGYPYYFNDKASSVITWYGL